MLFSRRVNPFELFQQMNQQYWRQLFQSGLIHALLRLSDVLAFEVEKSLCSWILDLMLEADKKERIAITSLKWFELVFKTMQSDESKLTSQVGWTFLKMEEEDPGS